MEAPESMVRDIFIICGSISRVQIGRPEGFAPKTTHAIVSYERVQDANVAFGALAGFPLMGHSLVLVWSEDSRRGEEAHQKRLNSSLEDWQYNFMTEHLKNLTISRKEIAKVMIFAVENCLESHAIAQCIVQSMFEAPDDANYSRKLACLYLIHDILSNSAESFISDFEIRLGAIATALHRVANGSALGRLTRINFNAKILSIFQIWDSRRFFSTMTISTANHLFSGQTSRGD